MTMMLGPSKAVLAGEVEGSKPPADAPAEKAAPEKPVPEGAAPEKPAPEDATPGNAGAETADASPQRENGHQNGVASGSPTTASSDAAA
jgi:hypothetical protein